MVEFPTTGPPKGGDHWGVFPQLVAAGSSETKEAKRRLRARIKLGVVGNYDPVFTPQDYPLLPPSISVPLYPFFEPSSRDR